jgi:hypothetical protein
LEEGMQTGEFRAIPLEELTFILFGLFGGLSVSYYQYDNNRIVGLYRTAIDILLQGIER